jgi:hypothetical protein
MYGQKYKVKKGRKSMAIIPRRGGLGVDILTCADCFQNDVA